MEEFARLLKDFIARVEALEKRVIFRRVIIPTDGYFVVQKVTVDPASPIEGQMWENTTTHLLKIYLNGTVRTVSLVP